MKESSLQIETNGTEFLTLTLNKTVKIEHRSDWFIHVLFTGVQELLDPLFKIRFPVKMFDGLVKMYIPQTQLHFEK